jgi:acyl dehydratase
MTPEPHRVVAYNTARDSENKIHDNEIARRFGFGGGLVPGVDVYAYMSHLAVMRWGRDWLARGETACRLLKPVYDGEIAVASAAATAAGLELTVESRGEVCAAGSAALPAEAAPMPQGFAKAPAPPQSRPPADEAGLRPGRTLAINPLALTEEYLRQYLADVRESAPIYAAEGLLHPGTILRTANWALSHNFVMGPWIHTGSRVRHLSLAHIGDEITARARIAANYEKKGHRFVDLDVLVLKNGETPIAVIAHTAIWRPRQLAAA